MTTANHSELLDTLRLRRLLDAASDAVDSIKINDIYVSRDGDRPIRVKRRRKNSEKIAAIGNAFFWLANARISVFSDVRQWQQWEISSFLLVNGDEHYAFARGPRSVCMHEIPGKDLRSLLAAERLDKRALGAAGRELRRAHRLWFEGQRGTWSHGDLTLANVIYDSSARRARFIDFEVMHDRALPATERHADDLLVLLQDMVGRVSARQWLPFALAFLSAYGRPAVIKQLKARLVIPNGLPGLWWSIRCNHFDKEKLARRFHALRVALDAERQSPR